MTNLLQFLGPSSRLLIHALGWALLHFCWQGALVAGCLWCVLGLTDGRSARLRYGAACCSIFLMIVLPVVTFGYLVVTARHSVMVVQRPMVAWFSAASGGGGLTGMPGSWLERLVERLDYSVPWVLVAWLVGVFPLLGRLTLGLTTARRMKFVGTEPAAMELQVVCRDLCRRLGVARAVKLTRSSLVQVPTVIGWLRPVILLPLSALAGMSAGQVEALLAHELAHIRRHDYLVAVFQSVVETLLFYHPAVWWVSAQVRRERECCCDDMAVAVGGDSLAYAKALSFLEEYRASNPQIALGANGGVLTMRIKRLLGYEENRTVSPLTVIALLMVVVVLSGVCIARIGRAQPVASAVVVAPPSEVHAASDVTEPPRAVRSTPGPQSKASVKASPAIADAYQRWMDEDVVWILAPEERVAFLSLSSDEERDHFIQQFWLRRDPVGEPPYSFRTQHYERLAYVNNHFAGSAAGWKTDRGHIYVAYGRPDAIDSHPAVEQGKPYETWHYDSIPGLGKNIDFKFVDVCGCGDFRMETVPKS